MFVVGGTDDVSLPLIEALSKTNSNGNENSKIDLVVIDSDLDMKGEYRK